MNRSMMMVCVVDFNVPNSVITDNVCFLRVCSVYVWMIIPMEPGYIGL